MLTTADQLATATERSADSGDVVRRIDAPVQQVWSLLADVHSWPRWGPFNHTEAPAHVHHPGLAQPIRLGRHQLRVAVTSPTAYRLRYSLTAGRLAGRHSAEISLVPAGSDGTVLRWRPAPARGALGASRRRRLALASDVARLMARLASAAEDPPTTRADWTHRRVGAS